MPGFVSDVIDEVNIFHLLLYTVHIRTRNSHVDFK